MITVPIINVTSTASAGAAAANSGASTSSGQSFGQVLSREVNGRNSSGDSSTAGNGSAQANTGVSAQAGASTSAATTGTSKGKAADKSKQSTNSSQGQATTTAASSAAGSAQILALVSNVQQSTGGTPAADSAAGDSIAALSATASAAAAGATTATDAALQAVNTAAADGSQATAPDAAALAAAAADTAATKPSLDAKDLQQPGTQSAEDDSDAASQNTTLGQGQAATTPNTLSPALQASLDLASTAEKNIQSGLAQLDANATAVANIKLEQTPPPIATAAVAQTQAFDLQGMQGAAADNKITPQVGSPGWDQALGQKVMWMVAGGQQSASLTLNPPDLGPMQVVLNVNNSHATATFTAAQPEVRQALESAMPRLREMLGGAGIQLGQATVNSGAQQQNAPAQRDAQQTARGGNSTDSADASIAAVSRSGKITTGLGLVDTFA